jgi:transposase
MKVQEVILRALARKITWWQAAEILGISDRHMRRWRGRYEEFGYDGLYDRRLGKVSPRRVPMAQVERILELYRERYFDLNVKRSITSGWQTLQELAIWTRAVRISRSTSSMRYLGHEPSPGHFPIAHDALRGNLQYFCRLFHA